jgi:hypothetical protein
MEIAGWFGAALSAIGDFGDLGLFRISSFGFRIYATVFSRTLAMLPPARPGRLQRSHGSAKACAGPAAKNSWRRKPPARIDFHRNPLGRDGFFSSGF